MKVIKNPKLPGKVAIGRWLVGAKPVALPDEVKNSISFKNALAKNLIKIVDDDTKTISAEASAEASAPAIAPSEEAEETESGNTETVDAVTTETEAPQEAPTASEEQVPEAKTETTSNDSATEKGDNAEETKLFACPYCDKSYKTQAALKAHITKTHPEHKE